MKTLDFVEEYKLLVEEIKEQNKQIEKKKKANKNKRNYYRFKK